MSTVYRLPIYINPYITRLVEDDMVDNMLLGRHFFLKKGDFQKYVWYKFASQSLYQQVSRNLESMFENQILTLFKDLYFFI